MNNQGGDSSVSFDKRYFDIKGAQSLAILKEGDTSSSAASNIIFSTDSNGPAVMSFGDNAIEKTSLYKTNELGEYVKVKLYDTQQKAEEGTDEIKNDYSPVAAYVTDNGKYAYLIMGVYKENLKDYRDVKSLIVSLDTGKIYELPLNIIDPAISPDSPVLSYNYEDRLLAPEGEREPIYKYIGCSRNAMFFRIFSEEEYRIYSAVEDNEGIRLKEIVNSSIISDSGLYKIYANGIIRMFSPSITDNNSTLIFADGNLKKISNDKLFECGDYLCTSVTYNDPATKYFPSTASVITDYDSGETGVKTEEMTFTNQQSYEMMQKTTYPNEIAKSVESNSTILITMNSVNSITRTRLSDDLTSSDLGSCTVPFKLGTLNSNLPVSDDSASPGSYCYTVRNGHICQGNKADSIDGVNGNYSPSDVVIDDGRIHKFENNTMNQYNLSENENKALTVTGLYSVTTMEVDYHRVMITGVSEGGQAVSGYLNFSEMSATLVKTNVLREVKIAALS